MIHTKTFRNTFLKIFSTHLNIAMPRMNENIVELTKNIHSVSHLDTSSKSKECFIGEHGSYPTWYQPQKAHLLSQPEWFLLLYIVKSSICYLSWSDLLQALRFANISILKLVLVCMQITRIWCVSLYLIWSVSSECTDSNQISSKSSLFYQSTCGNNTNLDWFGSLWAFLVPVWLFKVAATLCQDLPNTHSSDFA